MKIVDPIGGDKRYRARVGWRTCACGCFVLLVLFILLGLPLLTALLRGGPVPTNQPDPAAAQRLQVKLDTIERHYDPMALLRGDTFRTTEMSEAEINAYIEAIRPRLQPPWDEAMRGLHIDIESGRIVIRSEIALNELGGDALKALPWPYQVETRIDLIGRLDTIEGKGRFILETMKLGALPIPGDTALDLLVRLAPKAGPYRELLKGFPLPFGAQSLEAYDGKIVIQGSSGGKPESR